MGDTFRKVQPNEPLRIQADTFNTMLDAARAHQAQQNRMGAEKNSGQARGGIILIRNDSGGDRDRFGIVALDQPIFDPDDNEDEFKNHLSLVGIEPEWPLHAGRYAILLEPIAEAKIGRGLIVGVTPVRVNVIDEDHRFAEIAAGEMDRLKSGVAGSAQILWKEPGEGVHWAVVRVGLPPGGECIFELTVSLGPGSHADAVFCRWNGSTWAVTTESLVVWDAIDTFSGSAGQQGLARLEIESGRWVVWQLRC